ncbi:MAG TPA: hypothetical protein VHY34_11260 [Caulobacteraceae bacterium]|jgi:hypothetical protein|nr:hypothetical protein [Caulobacteraceae bacterium]
MSWRKLGMIYKPSGVSDWAVTNAAYPTTDLRSPDRLRIYFTSLDSQNFGRGGFLDVDPADPRRILHIAERPILDIGEIGDFDDSGANPFAVIEFENRRLMYYQGWQRTLRAPFTVFTGLAIEEPDGSFRKWSRVPVLERTAEEPHIRGAPCLMIDGGRLRMWYVSSARWTRRAEGLHYHVSIRHAVSGDGVNWTADPGLCIQPAANEYAVGRPWVVRDGDAYRMWYSVRSFDQPYAIGYAESDDGLTWRRLDDHAGIFRSKSGWDSEMICFPNVVDVGGRRLLFYNGNHHGASGFGCAEWVRRDVGD